MSKKIILVLMTLSMLASLPAQNEMYMNLRKVFVSGTIAEKTQVIESAADLPGSERLIADGLSFSDIYGSLLGNEPQMIELAAKSVQNADKCDGAETYSLIMSIFQKYTDVSVRQAVFNYLLKTKRTSDKTASIIEDYAADLLNDRFADDDHMLSCIAVLDKIHSNTSFRVLFDYASSKSISEEVQGAARQAMNRLTDVYRISMLSIISDSPVTDKLNALQMILENETNSDVLRAEAAETALSTSIMNAGDTFDTSKTDLQMMALAELRRLSWTRSANLLASFFPIARSEFEAGILLPEQFIEVIASVQELSVIKAGSLFTDYLNYINANVENGLSCSVPVVLAVISSLGALGDKVAFDALLYVSYVPYPDEVILASREALARLKW